MKLRTSLVSLLALAGLACAKTSGNASTSQTFDDCNEVIDALTAASIRCGQDENTSRQMQLDMIVDGDCAKVTSIRDHAMLQNECLSSLAAITCSDLNAHNLDEACKLQLIRPTVSQ